MPPKPEEIDALVERVKGSLDEHDYRMLRKMASAYRYARHLVQVKGMTAARFRKLFLRRLRAEATTLETAAERAPDKSAASAPPEAGERDREH